MDRQKTPAVPPEVAAHRAQMDALRQQQPGLAEDGYVSLDALDRQGQAELRGGATRGKLVKLVRGNPLKKEIALTIDDGPHPGYTERLIAVLRDAKVKATFFVVGRLVDDHPELIRKEVAAGHEIANHTYSHFRLPKMSGPTMMEKEIVYGSQAIQRAVPGAKAPDYFRPPGGEYNDDVMKIVARHQYTNVLWTNNPGDYRPGMKADSLARLLILNATPGGIILLHSGIEATVKALPVVLRELKRRGYTFVTCSQMGRDPNAIRHGGPNTHPEKKG